MKKREVDAKLDAIVEFSGVERFIDTPIKRYSSGMRMRLGFSVAAHLEPDVLIVDEVLAVGDAAFQKKCITAMQDLRGGGRTVLFVSHNMAAVENLCSRGIWIANGQMRLDGPTARGHREVHGLLRLGRQHGQRAHVGRRPPRQRRDPLHQASSSSPRSASLQTVTRAGKGVVVSPALPRERADRAARLRLSDALRARHAGHRHQHLAARPRHSAGTCRRRVPRTRDRLRSTCMPGRYFLRCGSTQCVTKKVLRGVGERGPSRCRGGPGLQLQSAHRQPLRPGVLSAALASGWYLAPRRALEVTPAANG